MLRQPRCRQWSTEALATRNDLYVSFVRNGVARYQSRWLVPSDSPTSDDLFQHHDSLDGPWAFSTVSSSSDVYRFFTCARGGFCDASTVFLSSWCSSGVKTYRCTVKAWWAITCKDIQGSETNAETKVMSILSLRLLDWRLYDQFDSRSLYHSPDTCLSIALSTWSLSLIVCPSDYSFFYLVLRQVDTLWTHAWQVSQVKRSFHRDSTLNLYTRLSSTSGISVFYPKMIILHLSMCFRNLNGKQGGLCQAVNRERPLHPAKLLVQI